MQLRELEYIDHLQSDFLDVIESHSKIDIDGIGGEVCIDGGVIKQSRLQNGVPKYDVFQSINRVSKFLLVRTGLALNPKIDFVHKERNKVKLPYFDLFLNLAGNRNQDIP